MNEIMEGQACLFDPVIASGRMCQEPSPQTKEKTSKRSSRSSSGSLNRAPLMCLCLKKESGQKPGASTMSWGGWSVAYRLHDAQHWGVPQRRKRLCVLADFNGLSAAELLFDPQYRRDAKNPESDETEPDSGRGGREVPALSEGLSGDPEPGGETGERTPAGTESGAGSTDQETDGTICLQGNGIDRADTAGCNGSGWRRGAMNPWDAQSARVYVSEGVWHSLNANENGGQSRDSVLKKQLP